MLNRNIFLTIACMTSAIVVASPALAEPLTPAQVEYANALCQNQFAQTADLQYDVWDLWKRPAIAVVTLKKVNAHCLINESWAMQWKKEDTGSTFYTTTSAASGETEVDVSGCKIRLRSVLTDMARNYGWNVDSAVARDQIEAVANYNCDNAATKLQAWIKSQIE